MSGIKDVLCQANGKTMPKDKDDKPKGKSKPFFKAKKKGK